jgi:hypothetical protein
VPAILDPTYPLFIKNFFYHQLDPSAKFRQFEVDMDYDDLDCYDEVSDFLF